MEFDRMLLVQDWMDPVRQSLTDHIHPGTTSAAVIADFFPHRNRQAGASRPEILRFL